MERIKMRREDRAKQFAPFDALKGLQEALRMKEYEHDRSIKGDLSEEKIKEISDVLLSLKKYTPVEVQYFFDGYIKTISGKSVIDIIYKKIKVANLNINFDDILDIKVLN